MIIDHDQGAPLGQDNRNLRRGGWLFSPSCLAQFAQHGSRVRTCGVQETLVCLDSYQEGDYNGIMLRLEYSSRTIIKCGDLPDSNMAGMGSAIACLSSAHQ